MSKPNKTSPHPKLGGGVRLPWFPDQTILMGGHLRSTDACMACWYYYLIAQKTKRLVGKGPESQTLEYNIHASIAEMPNWIDKRYAAQIRSVAMLYRCTVEEMQAYWPEVQREALRLGMDLPEQDFMFPPTEDRIT